MNTTPPTEYKAWQDLAHHAESWRGVHLRRLFEQDVARAIQLAAEGPGVRYDYSRQRMGAMTVRLLVDALGDGTLDVRFAANIDPKDLERALDGADPATTLFVIASKTFTTQE